MASQLSLEEIRKERERLRKRKNGIIKKAEQFRRVSDVDVAVLIHDRSAGEYHSYRSNKSFAPAIEEISQASTAENFLPEDFTTDDDSDVRESPRKKIPDIRLKTSPKKTKTRKGKRMHTRRHDSLQRRESLAMRDTAPPSVMPPPPKLPSFIGELAILHQQNMQTGLTSLVSPRSTAIPPVAAGHRFWWLPSPPVGTRQNSEELVSI